MTDNPTTPDPGEYTDEETADGRSTHRAAETPGQYEDAEDVDGTRAARPAEEPGEYTDVDEDGER